MKKFFKGALLLLSLVRLIPHLIIYFAKPSALLAADLQRWNEVIFKGESEMTSARLFVELMTHYPEFRNLFYKRSGITGRCFAFLCPGMQTLYLLADNIGPGLYIQHGFATVVLARSVGANCWINQQVTIGYSKKGDMPIIGDNVIINAGAKVIGGITVASNVTIGANAVVVKDVPPNVTVAGVPARIVRREGVRVDQPL